MRHAFRFFAVLFFAAGALAFGSLIGPGAANAAPLPVVKSAAVPASSPVVQVRRRYYRHGYYGPHRYWGPYVFHYRPYPRQQLYYGVPYWRYYGRRRY